MPYFWRLVFSPRFQPKSEKKSYCGPLRRPPKSWEPQPWPHVNWNEYLWNRRASNTNSDELWKANCGFPTVFCAFVWSQKLMPKERRQNFSHHSHTKASERQVWIRKDVTSVSALHHVRELKPLPSGRDQAPKPIKVMLLDKPTKAVPERLLRMVSKTQTINGG